MSGRSANENGVRDTDNELVSVGASLLIVAAVLVLAMSGSVDAALVRVDPLRPCAALGAALRSLAGLARI